MNLLSLCNLLTVLVLTGLAPVQATSPAIDIQPLLAAERSSAISAEAQNTLRKQLDLGPLSKEKILELVQSPQVATLCYVNQFFNNAANGKPYTQSELRDREFTAWLAQRPEIFKMLANSGYGNRNVLSVFYQVWQKNNKNLTPVEISMALGAGLAADSLSLEECITKFDFYQDSHRHGKCYPQADTLQPWEWAIVLRGKESIEDLSWAQQFIEGKKIKPEQAGGKFTGFIPYRMKNHKGVSVHAGAPFYDNKPITLKLYTEYGGVCGAVSKGASGFLRAKGVPAHPIGQPGHCAFVWKTPQGHWQIGNNIGGWNWANGANQIPWKGHVQFLPTYDAFLNHAQAEESTLMYYLSCCTQKPEHLELLLQEARKANPFNYPAWLRYLNIKTKSVSDKQKLIYLKEFAQSMPNEHNLIWYVANKVLNIREKKVDPYELYACLIGPDCKPQSEELFTRQVWNRFIMDCPEIQTPEYKEGFTGKHFAVWIDKAKYKTWSTKMKNHSVKMLQKVIQSLQTREKTRAPYVGIYQTLIKIWNDNKLSKDADDFLKKQLTQT